MSNVPSGKKPSAEPRVASECSARARALPVVAIVAVDERRAEPPQDEARDRHAAHLVLDQIRETCGQRRRQNDAVEVARVIRDDDARVVRLDRVALDAHGTADDEEEEPRAAARATRRRRMTPGVTASTTHSRHDDDEQREPGVAAVAQDGGSDSRLEESCDAEPCGSCDVYVKATVAAVRLSKRLFDRFL